MGKKKKSVVQQQEENQIADLPIMKFIEEKENQLKELKSAKAKKKKKKKKSKSTAAAQEQKHQEQTTKNAENELQTNNGDSGTKKEEKHSGGEPIQTQIIQQPVNPGKQEETTNTENILSGDDKQQQLKVKQTEDNRHKQLKKKMEEKLLEQSQGIPVSEPDPDWLNRFVKTYRPEREHTAVDPEAANNLFLKLLQITTEPFDLDFKGKPYDLKTPAGEDEFLRDVVSLYNGVGGGGLTGTDGSPAAFIILGVNNKQERSKNRIVGIPYHEDNAVYARIIQSNCMPFIEVIYHHVPYNCGMIEIRKRAQGPVYLKNHPGKLFSRVDGTNVPPARMAVEPQLVQRVHAQFTKDFDVSAVADIQQTLKSLGSHKEYYKLLVVTAPAAHEIHFQELKKLGSVGWNLVLDLDHFSRLEGPYKVMEQTLHSIRDPVPIVNVDQYLKRKDYPDIQIKTMWVLLNGCAYSQFARPTKSAKIKSNATAFLKFFFEGIVRPLPFLCMILIMSDNLAGEIGTLIDVIQTEYDARESVGEDELIFMIITTDPVWKSMLRLPVAPKIKLYCIPLVQFLSGISSIFEKVTETQVPGVSGPAGIQPEMLVKINHSMTLYHLQCTQHWLDKLKDLEHPEKEVEELEETYASGGELTPEMLHHGIPILRKEGKVDAAS